jgi:hypothetical protein
VSTVLVNGRSGAYTAVMFASTGVTAAVITVAAGLLGVAGVSRASQQPVPLRVRVRRGVRIIRRR